MPPLPTSSAGTSEQLQAELETCRGKLRELQEKRDERTAEVLKYQRAREHCAQIEREHRQGLATIQEERQALEQERSALAATEHHGFMQEHLALQAAHHALQTEHETLQAGHAAIQAEYASLQQTHVALHMEHEALHAARATQRDALAHDARVFLTREGETLAAAMSELTLVRRMAGTRISPLSRLSFELSELLNRVRLIASCTALRGTMAGQRSPCGPPPRPSSSAPSRRREPSLYTPPPSTQLSGNLTMNYASAVQGGTRLGHRRVRSAGRLRSSPVGPAYRGAPLIAGAEGALASIVYSCPL